MGPRRSDFLEMVTGVCMTRGGCSVMPSRIRRRRSFKGRLAQLSRRLAARVTVNDFLCLSFSIFGGKKRKGSLTDDDDVERYLFVSFFWSYLG